MGFIQGGAKNVKDNRNGAIIKTKKELKELVKEDPANVYFYSTGMFGNQFNGNVSNMHSTDSLTVVGPDPYNARNWYATISKNKETGKITVK